MKRRPCILVCLLGAALASTEATAQVRDLPLRFGDRILVKIWTDTAFSDTARVQLRGIVVFPRLGVVSIDRLRTSEIQDSVRRAYARLIREATVEVTPLRRVTVAGEVRRPAVYFLEPQSNVRDAIAVAGGINDIGVMSRITLLRDSSQTRLKGWQRRNDDDVVVRSGDVLIVDRESWFKRNAFTVVSGTSVLLSIIITLTRR